MMDFNDTTAQQSPSRETEREEIRQVEWSNKNAHLNRITIHLERNHQ